MSLRPAVLLHASARSAADSCALQSALQHLAESLSSSSSAAGGVAMLVGNQPSLADVSGSLSCVM